MRYWIGDKIILGLTVGWLLCTGGFISCMLLAERVRGTQ